MLFCREILDRLEHVHALGNNEGVTDLGAYDERSIDVDEYESLEQNGVQQGPPPPPLPPIDSSGDVLMVIRPREKKEKGTYNAWKSCQCINIPYR